MTPTWWYYDDFNKYFWPWIVTDIRDALGKLDADWPYIAEQLWAEKNWVA